MKAGWTYKNLADLCTFFGDGDWIESKDQSSNGIRLIQTGNVGEGVFKDRGDKARYINEETFDRLRCTEIFEGDCLISRLPDPVGRSAILADTGERMITAVDCTIVRFNHQLCLPEFFNYYSQSIEYINSVSERCTGTTRNRISRSQLGNTPIPTPEVGEQRRIVTLLDEAFADIATAKANAEKNLQNSRGLFASRMQKLFDEDQSWERVQLEELLSRGWITSHLDGNHGSDYPRKEEFVDSGVPYIAARSLRGWEVDFNEAKYLTHERAATIRKGLAQNGDVLFAHNATVGPVGILKTNEPFVILGTSLTYYRCKEDFILPEYLAHYMRSPAFVDQYSQVMKQSTRNQVPITKQREFFHVIPPLSIQQKIASDLDSLAEKIEQLESIYHEKLTALDDLKKSLLHQAFHGQL